MKRTLLLLLVGMLSHGFASADDYDVLYERLYADYVANTPVTTQTTIQGYMNTQQADGSWTTINYDSHTYIGGWAPLDHWDKLLHMAVALKKPTHGLYADSVLKTKIKLGLLYWYNRANQPYSDNWFDNDINLQTRLYKILILVKNDFSSEPDFTNVIKEGCDNYLVLPEDYATTNKRLLTNAVWIARNLVHHGVIKKDQAKLQQGNSNMAAQLVVKSVNVEGVQRDNSFLTHGLQLYNSGYGNELIKEISYYMYQARGLSLVSFSAAQIATIGDLILKGDQWMIHGGTYDFSVRGRNISRENNGTTAYLTTILPRMQAIDPSKNAQYQTMLNHISDATGATSGVLGNKHFFRADLMTHKKPNLYIGVKMCSERTRGTESLNNENLLGNWLPFGSTTIMRTGAEYFNIFGVWDWSKIPGVTNPGITITWPVNTTTNNTQSTTFVGGVSDGTNGVTGMDFSKVTVVGGASVDISARKANFLWNNEMICLGAGITSSYTSAPTTTTLNQVHLNGPVLLNGASVPQQESTYSNVRWIHHDNTGYVFRSNTTAKMKTNSQSGNWYTINQAQTNAVVSSSIFKLWLDHGTAPSNATYEYAVLPNFTSAQTDTYATAMPVETVLNTTSIQAVTHKTLKQTGAVFYVAGILNINATLKVAVDKPCILLIDWGANPIKVTASDPNQSETALNVTVTYSGLKSETIAFALPYSNAIGASTTKTAATTRIIDERFYDTLNMDAIAGGTWSIVSGELQLSNPISNTLSTPANINLCKTTVTGDFVMTARGKTTATSSNDDLCLIWNHQKPTNSYYYANFSETNDAENSGVFKVVGGVKTQLADITTGVSADSWNSYEVQKVGSTMKIILNGVTVAEVLDSSFSNGYVGVGSYGNACQFDNLSVLKYNTSLNNLSAALNPQKVNLLEFENIASNSHDVQVYPNPTQGKFNVRLSGTLPGGNIKVFDSVGRLLYSVNRASSETTISLDNSYKGIGVIVVEKGDRKVAQKVILE